MTQTATRAANIAHKAVGGFLIGATVLLGLNATSMVVNIVYRANKASKSRELDDKPVEEKPLPKLI
ncbi:hypothetical protein SpCBS45565_g01508 [Spizellomyces sp. 'palustris']|uniref:Uncharacterized protein n=1 Tax=Spizellomyces punctatus (strain DAOM BR117) TaxID=645134 RepID=A0A0L0HBU1_SPIPD|nr:uncharacterized protein SPPG_09393 [Spizellomyces punctatus DAOM BR117]KNC98208.1 hypothetical protein SPPG_09393 [Spizellomyces punctatus DAOM BR117]TPX70800.1 hypothetical protein SpCBS45565_g01508 [Spizellomyces sp. 'palustris']|eukprot:XP_016606248.1 hypothetical protein SPPG_09393 [Spizellomyces punctatus DAOM BR117]